MPKKRKSAKQLREEAIKIREKARFIKKQTEELIKKNNPAPKVPRDAHGRVLPGNRITSGSISPAFSLKAMIKKKLQEIEPRNRKTYAELLVTKIIKMAIIDGNDAQIKNILQYLEGMPKQTLEGNIDVKTALVHFIGGAIQGANVEQIEEGKQVEQLESKQEIDRVEDEEMEIIESGNN